MSTMRSWEAKNCLITHLMPIKPCKCLIKAFITNKNHLTRTRKTSQKLPKWKNRKKMKKRPKIPVSNMKFAVVFLGCNHPPPNFYHKKREKFCINEEVNKSLHRMFLQKFNRLSAENTNFLSWQAASQRCVSFFARVRLKINRSTVVITCRFF